MARQVKADRVEFVLQLLDRRPVLDQRQAEARCRGIEIAEQADLLAGAGAGGAPGMALGAALGATTGLSGDVVMEALDSDFVDSVTTDMRPGMTAIIVEANEGSTRAVDDIVALGGGHVYRQAA